MGIFATVEVPCPKCGTMSSFQSKSDEYNTNNYTLKEVPAKVMLDVNRHAPNKCAECDTWFEVDFEVEMKVTKAESVEVEPPSCKSCIHEIYDAPKLCMACDNNYNNYIRKSYA